MSRGSTVLSVDVPHKPGASVAVEDRPTRGTFDTGATKVRTCETCGARLVFAEVLVAGHRWWHPGPHAAPCGAPCADGGGVDACAPAAEIAAWLAASHAGDRCGSAGCRGGKLKEKRATRGTEHTVGLAERAGLTVDARVWPKGATT